MANSDKPNGARPVGTLSGAPISGTVRSYLADGSGSDIFIGDFVEMNDDGFIDVAAAASVELIGVCVGFQNAQPGQTDGVTDHFMSGATDVDRQKKYYDASADGEMYILVAQGPDVLYEIQTDGTITFTDIGNNAEIVDTAGDTTRGISQQELSATTTAATAQLRIVGPVNRVDNEVASANSRWIVRINENHYTKLAGL